MDLIDVILSKKVLGVVLIILGFSLTYFIFKTVQTCYVHTLVES